MAETTTVAGARERLRKLLADSGTTGGGWLNHPLAGALASQHGAAFTGDVLRQMGVTGRGGISVSPADIGAEGGALSLSEARALGPYAEAYAEAQTPELLALMEMLRLEESNELAQNAWQAGLKEAEAQATGTSPLFSAASEYVQGRLGGPAREIPNAFTDEIANLIGGESSDALAAQYGAEERRIHDSYKQGAISRQEYDRAMRSLERSRAGAMMSAYREPKIAQAEAAQRLGLASQELDVQERQGLLGSAASLERARTGALSTLGQFSASMPGTDSGDMMRQLAEAAAARRQVAGGQTGNYVRSGTSYRPAGSMQTLSHSAARGLGLPMTTLTGHERVSNAQPMSTGSVLTSTGPGLSKGARRRSAAARGSAEGGRWGITRQKQKSRNVNKGGGWGDWGKFVGF
jgi:hypothetical protein